MGGRYSRQKGIRAERDLIEALNEYGYKDVKRVPLSGAAQGFKHDVLCKDESGREISFEAKCWEERFDWLYRYIGGQEVIRLAHRDGRCVAVGVTPMAADTLGFGAGFNFTDNEKLFNRIMKLNALRAGADFLALKANRKQWLYLRFWGVPNECNMP